MLTSLPGVSGRDSEPFSPGKTKREKKVVLYCLHNILTNYDGLACVPITQAFIDPSLLIIASVYISCWRGTNANFKIDWVCMVADVVINLAMMQHVLPGPSGQVNTVTLCPFSNCKSNHMTFHKKVIPTLVLCLYL